MMKNSIDLRPSPIAGRWYSDDPQALSASIDRYITQVKLPPITGQIIGVIAPHAGHLYSGPVAGYAFAAVRGLRPDIVVVVSPMHQAYYQPLLTTAHDGYTTPLGAVMVEPQIVADIDQRLEENLGFGLSPVKRDQEHSLEIELPFLQRALGEDFKLVPVMVRDQSPAVAQALGQAIAQALAGHSYLLVASTDLSHFYPQAAAKEFDREMLEQFEAFSPEGIFHTDAAQKGFACGMAAVATVLWAGRDLGADNVKVLHWATSGDVTGDYESVVGYGAAVITKSQ